MNIDNHCIRHWKASLYRDVKKKWIHGDFLLTAKYVCFRNTSPDNNEPCQIIILFEDFSQLMKAKSLFIFDCIVINVDKTNYWFSSFLNRDAVFNFVNHFWRERLFAVPHQQCVKSYADSNSKSDLGQNLLKLTADSEKTLSSAATQLEAQGSQLKNAYANMFDLENDLDLAEKVISGLEKWMGLWNISNKVSQLEPFEIVQNSVNILVYEIPVLFTSHVYATDVLHVSGTLSVSTEGITIHDKKQTLIQHYPIKHVSTIRIVSPYEFIIAKHLIGKPDVVYTIISTKLSDLIQNIEPIYRTIISYDDYLTDQSVSNDNIGETVSTKYNPSIPPSEMLHVELPKDKSLKVIQLKNNCGQQQLLKDRSGKSITLSEAQDLDDSIGRLKNMAIDIGVEQNSQLSLIDNLTNKVSSCDDKLQSATRRINRLK